MECAKRRRIRVALALIDHVDEEESHVEMMMDFVYAAAVLHVHQQRSLDDRAAADAISIPRVVRERWGELRKHKLDADTRVLKAGCPEVLFVKSMRMRRSTFDALVDKCWLAADEYRDRHDRDGAPASRDHQRGARLKSTMQKEIAVSLYVLSGQESFDRVGWIWSVPPSQVSEYLWRFVGVVAELATEMITWPSSEEERAEVMEEFQRVSRLPFCVGAVDGCHIEIEAPKHHARDYICYKARNTIILLAVCDHNGRFRRVEVGYPGANNDAHVFQKTGMHEFLERECLGVQPRTHIVGDAAFELREHTLVGFERLTTVIMERLTNAAIDKARVKIVNAFSRLKNRWRRLKYLNFSKGDVPLRLSLTVMACCVLHNFVEEHEPVMDHAHVIYGQHGAFCPRNRIDARDASRDPFEDDISPPPSYDDDAYANTERARENGVRMRAQLGDFLLRLHNVAIEHRLRASRPTSA